MPIRLAVAILTLLFAFDAPAQSFPSKPIKLIVGFPAGGGSDAAARLTAQALAEKLGQPIVVENKPGANTILATQWVGAQPADGYTLLFVSASFAINPSLYKLETRASTSSTTTPSATSRRWRWWCSRRSSSSATTTCPRNR